MNEWRYLFDGRRTVPVLCSWRYCPRRDAAVLVRADTGRVVQTRTARPHERQLELFAKRYNNDNVGHTPGPKRRGV